MKATDEKLVAFFVPRKRVVDDEETKTGPSGKSSCSWLSGWRGRQTERSVSVSMPGCPWALAWWLAWCHGRAGLRPLH